MTRVLIIKPSSLGDIVHSLPLALAIKKKLPSAHITWLCATPFLPLVRHNPVIDEVIEFPRSKFTGILSALKFFRWLKLEKQKATGKNFDTVLDLQGLFRSALIARQFSQNPKRTKRQAKVIGLKPYRECAGIFYDNTVITDMQSHAVERYLQTLRAIFPDEEFKLPTSIEFPLPESKLSEETQKTLEQFKQTNFSKNKQNRQLHKLPYVIIHPYARGPGKQISKDATATICKKITTAGILTIIVGKESNTTKKETYANVDNVSTNKDAGDGNLILDLTNETTLLELMFLLKQASFVISSDSGPMHLSAALNENLLALHSWTNPAKVGPYPKNCWIWKNEIFGRISDLAKINAENPRLICCENRNKKFLQNLEGNFIDKSQAELIADFVISKILR